MPSSLQHSHVDADSLSRVNLLSFLIGNKDHLDVFVLTARSTWSCLAIDMGKGLPKVYSGRDEVAQLMSHCCRCVVLQKLKEFAMEDPYVIARELMAQLQALGFSMSEWPTGPASDPHPSLETIVAQMQARAQSLQSLWNGMRCSPPRRGSTE